MSNIVKARTIKNMSFSELNDIIRRMAKGATFWEAVKQQEMLEEKMIAEAEMEAWCNEDDDYYYDED